MKSFLSSTDEQTKKFAKGLARIGGIRIIGLTGGLGAGKTTFVQGFAQGLGIKEKIISPTFVLIRQHKIPNSQKMLYHVDLYRLDKIEDIKHLGIEEIIWDPNNVVLIEWAEKIKSLLPKDCLRISFKLASKDSRKIIFSSDLVI